MKRELPLLFVPPSFVPIPLLSPFVCATFLFSLCPIPLHSPFFCAKFLPSSAPFLFVPHSFVPNSFLHSFVSCPIYDRRIKIDKNVNVNCCNNVCEVIIKEREEMHNYLFSFPIPLCVPLFHVHSSLCPIPLRSPFFRIMPHFPPPNSKTKIVSLDSCNNSNYEKMNF